jgi:hypothetical protein
MIPELQESDLGCEELLFKTCQIGAATFVTFAARDSFDGNISDLCACAMRARTPVASAAASATAELTTSWMSAILRSSVSRLRSGERKRNSRTLDIASLLTTTQRGGASIVQGDTPRRPPTQRGDGLLARLSCRITRAIAKKRL